MHSERAAMIVVPGPASPKLGRKLADLLNAKIVPVVFKGSPEGESHIRFGGDISDEEVAIVQTTGPPQDTHLIQLFLMVYAAKNLGAKGVVAVVPYIAYARQDKRFLSGEAVSIKTIMSLLEASDLDRVITVNFHNPRILKHFRLYVENLSAIGLLAKYFKNKGLEGAFAVSLGKRALDVATQASEILKGGYGCIPTQRDYLTGKVKIEKKPLPVKNKDVIIFDDIISTSGTMIKAIELVKDQGARRVYAACVHPVLAGDAKDKIMNSGVEGIVGTDCIPSPVSVVSVTPLIARTLSDVFSG